MTPEPLPWRPFDLVLVEGPLAHRVRAYDRQVGSVWFLCHWYQAVEVGRIQKAPMDSEVCARCRQQWAMLNKHSFGTASPTCYEIREVAGFGTSRCPSTCAWVAGASKPETCIGGIWKDSSIRAAIEAALRPSRPDVSVGVDAPAPPNLDDFERDWGHLRSIDDIERK